MSADVSIDGERMLLGDDQMCLCVCGCGCAWVLQLQQQRQQQQALVALTQFGGDANRRMPETRKVREAEECRGQGALTFPLWLLGDIS